MEKARHQLARGRRKITAKDFNQETKDSWVLCSCRHQEAVSGGFFTSAPLNSDLVRDDLSKGLG